jgi:hypothetical protein
VHTTRPDITKRAICRHDRICAPHRLPFGDGSPTRPRRYGRNLRELSGRHPCTTRITARADGAPSRNAVPTLPCPSLVVYTNAYREDRGRAIARVYGSEERHFPDPGHWGLVLNSRVRTEICCIPRASRRVTHAYGRGDDSRAACRYADADLRGMPSRGHTRHRRARRSRTRRGRNWECASPAGRRATS